jgi:leader peptidase (prepilin peptidase)/N-methyltransferase
MTIQAVLNVTAVIAVNSIFAAAALCAAARCKIELSLLRGAGLAIMVTGTALESAVLAYLPDHSLITMIVGFGAVIACAASDAACGYVFDWVTLPALVVMSLAAAIAHTLPQFAGGALSAGASLAALYVLTRGRGVGLGDVKLACCIGGAAGVLQAMEALGIAFVIGGAYAAFLLTFRGARGKDELRFAPYLGAGMVIAMLHGALS